MTACKLGRRSRRRQNACNSATSRLRRKISPARRGRYAIRERPANHGLMDRDRDHLGDSPARVDATPGAARRATGSQVHGQLPAQLAARLDIQRPVNRLVADPHPLIAEMVDLQSGRDLLRRPAPPRPSSIAATSRGQRDSFVGFGRRASRRAMRSAFRGRCCRRSAHLRISRPTVERWRPRALAISLSLSPRQTPTKTRSRSSKESRCGEHTTRRRISAASSRTRHAEVCSTTNSAITSWTSAPARTPPRSPRAPPASTTDTAHEHPVS
jgi:hypothetical protein